jgi:hypothetical protein
MSCNGSTFSGFISFHRYRAIWLTANSKDAFVGKAQPHRSVNSIAGCG